MPLAEPSVKALKTQLFINDLISRVRILPFLLLLLLQQLGFSRLPKGHYRKTFVLSLECKIYEKDSQDVESEPKAEISRCVKLINNHLSNQKAHTRVHTNHFSNSFLPVTFEPDLDSVKANKHAKDQGQRSL